MHRPHSMSRGFICRILVLALVSSGLMVLALPSTYATTTPALAVPATAVTTPVTVTFTPTQTVGVTSTPQQVTFTYTGPDATTTFGAPTVTGTNASDFSVVTFTAVSGTVSLVTLTFTPSAAGMRTATLTVTDTSTTGPTETAVPLQGVGQVVTTGVAPVVTNFYSQAIGTTSTALPIFFTNGGPVTVTMGTLSITPTAQDFTIVADSCSGKQIAAQGTCAVQVVFGPTFEGLHKALIIFPDNGTGSPHAGVLLGRGVHQAGYWLSASDGGIFSFPSPGAAFYGSTGSLTLNKPIVGIAATPDGGGYWEVATDGGIFAFGDATFFGSTGSIHLNNPIVGMAATPTGLGYWLVASDGGIFAFGDALFYGSTGSIKLNKPIVGMASSQDGGGYWLVATDGGVFSFGDALFHGSTGSLTLNKPIVGMAPNHDGSGYWLVASDGGVFAFNAPFLGSTGSIKLNKPVVGMAATPTGNGYWMVATDGGVFSFPDAQFFGSTGPQRPPVRVRVAVPVATVVRLLRRRAPNR